MKALAAEGRTVFVSSHLMSEMENTADHLIVIGRGRLISDCTTAEFIAANSQQSVRVRTPRPGALVRLAAAAGGVATDNGGGHLLVQGLDPAHLGDLAYEHGTYTLKMTDKASGKTLQDVKNKHIHIMKRQADGSWKTWRMMVSSAESAPAGK